MTAMTTEGLLPELLGCPFCGGQARVSVLLSGPFVFCTICRGETSCHKTESEAIATWNQRPSTGAGAEAREIEAEDIARKAYEAGPPDGWECSHTWDDIDDEMRESCIAFTRNVMGALRSRGGEDGYRNAFYEIGAVLGIPARPESPKHVWETEMRPKLLAALADRGTEG